MAPIHPKTSTGRLDRRGKQYGIRKRRGCKLAVEKRLPRKSKKKPEKLWLLVEDETMAERLLEMICWYTDGIKAFPPDHPNLAQLDEFCKKEFQDFVMAEYEKIYPSVNQVSI